MTDLGRRAFLLGGGAALVSACSSSKPTTAPSTGPSRTPTMTPTRSSPSTPAGTPWQQLARHVRGTLLRPGSAGYDQARLVENPRYDDNRPLAVLTVARPQDVATALAFAADHQVPLAIRAGGHSYPGWSAGGAPDTGMPASLVLDCRALNQVTLDGTVARIGGGAALAHVYDVLGRADRAIPGGSCATVSVGGLTQGGGVGVLTRAFGLTCDAVTAMQVVTADSKIQTVDETHDPDLFWALRGGGGGHAGVVTSYTFDTRTAPTLATFYCSWPLDQAAAVIAAWQQWAPGADARLWSTLKGLGGARSHPSGPVLLLSGTWVGDPGALDHQLAGLLGHVPRPTVRSTHVRDYRTAMATYAGCANIPADRCHTGPGGSLQREAFAATSHVAYAPLDDAAIRTVLDHVEQAQTSGLHEAGISMDALGGHVRDLGASDTAFVHRGALMTVQYTATYSGDRAHTAVGYVRGLRGALLGAWGNHAYVNYADQAVADYRSAYFGANATRLAHVKSTYDPDGLFTQPQSW